MFTTHELNRTNASNLTPLPGNGLPPTGSTKATPGLPGKWNTVGRTRCTLSPLAITTRELTSDRRPSWEQSMPGGSVLRDRLPAAASNPSAQAWPAQTRRIHATIQHLLGLDFKKNTFPYEGREESLVNPARVLKEILA